MAEGLRDLPQAAAGQVKDGAGVRQEHRGYRPRRGKLRVGGDRRFDQGGGGLFPLGRLIRGQLGAGDGPHQAVHQDQAVPGRSDQGVAPQRDDRRPHGHQITGQRPDHVRDLGTDQASGLLIGEQQGQRDRFGGQEREQPHQAGRGPVLVFQAGQGQPQRGGHVRRMPGGFALRQQVGLPRLEHRQVAGQGGPGGLHVGGGLLQGQRQPAQLGGKLQRPPHDLHRRYG